MGKRSRSNVRDHPASKAKRARAMDLLLTGRSTAEVAAELGVNRRTVNRWREDPEFDEEFQGRQDEIRDALHARLVGHTLELVDVLVDVAKNADEKGISRVKAVQVAFELLGVHRTAPAKRTEKRADLEDEGDLVQLLLGVPERVLREVLEEKERQKTA